ncbi:cyclin-domain-containing protein [Chytridium lagenaria]|nr:cyclin-domain-containing protein [Chytridium lagenaria]
MLEVADFYNDVDVNVLIFLVAEILECLTAHNNRLTVNPANITRFHSKRAPDISIIEYLRRIVKHGAVNRSCLLSILVYMDRMCFRHNMFMISSLTVHRFIITAVTVSSKAHSDTYFSNRVYADVGGIPLRELNTLELDTLFHLNWDLQVTSDRLQTYYVNLIKRHKGFFFSKDRNEVLASGAPVVGQTTA